jgi:ribosome maturation factor RimP
MRQAVDGQTFFRGTLGGVDDGHVVIDADDRKRHRVPLGVITRANLEVEF